MIVWSLALVAAALLASTAAQDVDVKCMMTKCAGPGLRCGLSSNCRSAVQCIGTCGTNMTCTYKCIATYGDKTFDLFIDCAMHKNKCIKPPPDPHPITCQKPATPSLQKNFDLDKLLGKWYVIYGLNPTYDCFNKAWSEFVKGAGDTLVLTENYEVVTMKGQPKMMSQRENFGYINRTASSSVLYLRSKDPGIYRDDEFRIVAADPTYAYVLAYYCGLSSGLRYEGGVVYSRTPTLSDSLKTSLAADVAKHGWDFKKFCAPVPAS